MTSRPIDKKKPANHRCVNCVHWPKRTCYPIMCGKREARCEVGDRDIDYWNCCPRFEWNPRKTYTKD